MLRVALVLCALTLSTSALAFDTRALFDNQVKVLAFSQDGTRALVEERLDRRQKSKALPASTVRLRYVVVGSSGEKSVVELTANALDQMGNEERLACRAAAEELKRALVAFQGVHVLALNCASSTLSRTMVQVVGVSSEEPLTPDEANEIRKRTGVAGHYVATKAGPLVVVIGEKSEGIAAASIRVVARR